MELSGKSYHIELNLNWIFFQLLSKFFGIFQRAVDIILLLPKRVSRIFIHLWKGLTGLWPRETGNNYLGNVGIWWAGLVTLMLDCFGIGEIYEVISDFTKYNTRALEDWEIEMAKSVFGDTINYKRVRIDEYAIAGPRQMNLCYVSFYTINSWGQMQNSTLLHEMTHIWQYEKMGAIYIPLALNAQYSNMGYNYGGVKALQIYADEGKTIHDFNLEQQGDIVSDYFRLKKGYRPQWGNGNLSDLNLYEHFIDQIRGSSRA